jgi:hypothetical protein
MKTVVKSITAEKYRLDCGLKGNGGIASKHFTMEGKGYAESNRRDN